MDLRSKRRLEAPPPGELLRKGDPITIVYSNGLALLTYVTTRNGDGLTIDVQLPRTLETLGLEDEGRDWVRGHHLLDSPAVAAARTAQGL